MADGPQMEGRMLDRAKQISDYGTQESPAGRRLQPRGFRAVNWARVQ